MSTSLFCLFVKYSFKTFCDTTKKLCMQFTNHATSKIKKFSYDYLGVLELNLQYGTNNTKLTLKPLNGRL